MAKPGLRHYRCSRCFITTLSSRHEVWCPASGCPGLLMEIDPTGIELDAPLKDAYNEAMDGAIIDKLMEEIYAHLAEADNV